MLDSKCPGDWVEHDAFFNLGVLPGLRLGHLMALEATFIVASALLTPSWHLAAEFFRIPETFFLGLYRP